jgi:23S rRNA pseudouridine1911/1915/1917 synthase
MNFQTATSDAKLLPFLLEKWPQAGRTQIKNWLKHASVSVNGQRVVRHDHPLKAGDKVSISKQKLSRPMAKLPSGIVILHEDEAVIVIDKPAGLLTIGTDSIRENTAYFKLNAYLRERDRFSTNRIFIVHRLDRDTSGLLVFAKTPSAKHVLQDGWDLSEKIYYAVVEGTPKKTQDTIKSHLHQSPTFRVYSGPPSADSQLGITHYQVIRNNAARALLEVTLKTGRKNQIRVHLADIGHPIVGDEKYGAKTNPAKRMALHAHRLTFSHPISRQQLTFTSPFPAVLEKLVKGGAVIAV